jgi:hypothetical protein
MAVVDSETLERAREGCGILEDVIPEPWVVFWTGTVPKLDAIIPDNDLPTEVCLGGRRSKVFEGIRVPYPSIVGQGILQWVCFCLRQASKVRLHERGPAYYQRMNL